MKTHVSLEDIVLLREAIGEASQWRGEIQDPDERIEFDENINNMRKALEHVKTDRATLRALP